MFAFNINLVVVLLVGSSLGSVVAIAVVTAVADVFTVVVVVDIVGAFTLKPELAPTTQGGGWTGGTRHKQQPGMCVRAEVMATSADGVEIGRHVVEGVDSWTRVFPRPFVHSFAFMHTPIFSDVNLCLPKSLSAPCVIRLTAVDMQTTPVFR